MAMSVPEKRKLGKVRQSKNRKKGWKKHSNIDDVEQFLEEERQQERLGDATKKPNENLFFVDTELLKAKKKSKRKLLEKPLRCFQILTPSSSVPPPIKPYQLQTQAKGKKSFAKTKPKRTKRPAPNPIPTEGTKKNPFDLWDEKQYEKSDLFILASKIRRNETSNVPKHRYKKTSFLPAVETPHPGASYNPSFVDHQALLAEANEVEVKKEKAELHLERVLTQKFPTAAPTQQEWIKEMGARIFEDESDESDEEDEEDDEDMEEKTWGQPITRENKKLRSKRNAEKLAKQKLDEKKKEKILKRFKHEFNSVKKIKKEIAVKQEKTKQRIEKHQLEKKMLMYKPRKISREKYVAPDLELHLSEELTGNLRQTKVEGNILEDRYKSLQRRNIVEPRTRKKYIIKYKPKTQIKRSHRADQAEIDQLLRVRRRKNKRSNKQIAIEG